MIILVLIGVILDLIQLLIYFRQKRLNNERMKIINSNITQLKKGGNL